MIEELKILLEAVGDASDVALSVFIAFGIYKAIIYLSGVGAIVILTKLAIEKLHDWAVKDKILVVKTPEERHADAKKELQDIEAGIKNDCIDGVDVQTVIAQIMRIRSTSYIHGSDVRWLRDAISEKIAREGDDDRGIDHTSTKKDN